MYKNTRFSLSISICALFCSALVSAQTRIIAHRGYWDTAGSAQNSIASLRNAAKAGVYGSEFDVRMTRDGMLVLCHDDSIQGYHIETTPYSALSNLKLTNGEILPTLQQYLDEGKKHPKTQLILEIKPQRNETNDRWIAQTVVAMVEAAGMQSQVEYISFSMPVCLELRRLAPAASLAYLNGDVAPRALKALGFTGLDYHHSVLDAHPGWIDEAQALGLTVNVWTVNDDARMQLFIRRGVDFITTDKPVEANNK